MWGAVLLAAVLSGGVAGYMIIERWSFLDSLFMTVITITTVGYEEVHPLTSGGRIFSIFLILGGASGVLYTLTTIVQYILEGDLGTIWGRRRMRNRIEHLREHFILCGFGRVGETIATTFQEEGVPFVVVENDVERIAHLQHSRHLYIEGDATSDEVLREAGIERAKGLVAAVGTDVTNTYITLTARELCPSLFIEARANSQEAEKKLRIAGASRVVSPNSIGGRRMAMLAIRPAVVDFIDDVAGRTGSDLQMENVAISDESALAGQTIAFFRECSKANVLAINKRDGKLLANPPGDEKIMAGDSLIVIGTSEQLSSVDGICQGVIKDE